MAYGDIEITPGAGAPVAADLIAGVGFQRVKLVDGAEGGEDGIGGSAAGGLKVQVTNGTAAASTSAVTSVNDTASNTTLLASNADRKGLSIHNNSPVTLYVKFGATATTAAGGWSVKMPADSFYEMPAPVYTGQIDGIWSSDSTGYAEITELE